MAGGIRPGTPPDVPIPTSRNPSFSNPPLQQNPISSTTAGARPSPSPQPYPQIYQHYSPHLSGAQQPQAPIASYIYPHTLQSHQYPYATHPYLATFQQGGTPPLAGNGTPPPISHAVFASNGRITPPDQYVGGVNLGQGIPGMQQMGAGYQMPSVGLNGPPYLNAQFATKGVLQPGFVGRPPAGTVSASVAPETRPTEVAPNPVTTQQSMLLTDLMRPSFLPTVQPAVQSPTVEQVARKPQGTFQGVEIPVPSVNSPVTRAQPIAKPAAQPIVSLAQVLGEEKETKSRKQEAEPMEEDEDEEADEVIEWDLRPYLNSSGGLMNEAKVPEFLTRMSEAVENNENECFMECLTALQKTTNTPTLMRFIHNNGRRYISSWLIRHVKEARNAKLKETVPKTITPIIVACLRVLLMLPVEIEELKHSKAGKLVRLFQGFKGSGAGHEDEGEYF
ncbi:hypothetical protein HK097_002798 [Rhizophlyctis rosea]|uniref:Uncharacterized protein n=1 Tax=Rhizophlyctis rosea TaxID=64517 RepID=A0AAD5WZY9_9FUNG|nr:hypothetical protein HK097_002798 [Rhizophlyctis rosea]